MCLDRLRKFVIPKDRIGYKVFIKLRGLPMCKKAPEEFTSLYRYKQRTRIEGVEYHDEEDESIQAHNGKFYRNGFHIFASFGDALDYAESMKNLPILSTVIKKVKFDNVVATGIQLVFSDYFTSRSQELKTIVARTMTILPNDD